MNDFPSLDEQEARAFLVAPFDRNEKGLSRFRDFILSFYGAYGRDFPWRRTDDPYRILLSEVMLQQTQTARVLPKYERFLFLWPDFRALADSTLEELLYEWKGLGYNRRALNLRKAARMTEPWGWTIPDDHDAIISLPGVGKATSAAISAFCYHGRAVYLETNIRRVLLTCFFPDAEGVSDRLLESLLAELAGDVEDPKIWYYALMDYGVLLKHLLPNANRRSAHYTKQSRFENSNRQIRGLLIHILTETGARTENELLDLLSQFEAERVQASIESLQKEGFVQEKEERYRIKED